jgi:hypothetical protein
MKGPRCQLEPSENIVERALLEARSAMPKSRC